MHFLFRFPKSIAAVSALITCLFQAASAQSLYDVVISLSDRQRVVSQRVQVEVHLANQNNDPSASDATIPDDEPINWLGVGTDPTQAAVDGLGVGAKIALLNQAVAEFDRLKFAFLNSSPGEFEPGKTVGALKPHTPGDFEPLPRATPENHHELLRLLAQRVRGLRLIQWPVAFRARNHTDRTNVSEAVVYDDPYDLNDDGDFEPRVEIYDLAGAVVGSVTWKPDSIGSGNLDVRSTEPWTVVASRFDSSINISGSYSETPSQVDGITAPLRSQALQLDVPYLEEARVSATAPGADGTQVDGKVYVLRRSHWHLIDATNVSSRYDANEAGYVVEAGIASGTVSLFGSPPSATVNGSWITTSAYEDETGPHRGETFVAGGYQHKEAYTLPVGDEGHSDDYIHSYEQNWKIGCVFHSVFKPTFTRGLDTAGMQTKLESADGILAANAADGSLLLHPRPALLFGIDIGPGLKGAGNGFVSTSAMEAGSYIDFGYDEWSWEDLSPLARFDSSYSLQFMGSCSDYHVVYQNNRSNRTQSLPADGIGWPFTDGFGIASHDTTTLYRAWDTPRLKQVAGRDLLADITYNADHYGGYTVKIYRRPTGSAAPVPGQAMDLSGMTLIRTWTFSHTGGSTAHPTDAEKLEVVGSGNEKYEIQANEILPNQGLGWPYWFYYSYNWWWWTEGTRSWTLKLSQGITEKLKKEVEITTATENEIFVRDIALREYLDGQLVSSVSSETLDPFSDAFPADWEITSAGKTFTGTATLGGVNDPATRYGTLPIEVSILYDGVRPDLDATWDASGLLTSDVQGAWSTSGSIDGSAFKQIRKLNDSTVGTTWSELPGGTKLKCYSAPDGAVSGKGDPSVAWSEIEYGTAASGLPGLPLIVRNSDGSGTTYGWSTSGDGAYVLTLERGLLAGSSVSRGTKVIHDMNARGQPNKIETFANLGAELKTGGTVFSNITAWGMPKTATDQNTGLASTWNYANNLSRLSNHTDFLGVVSGFTGYDVLGRPATVSSNGISASKTYNALSTSTVISGDATGSIVETRDTLGRLTNGSTTWNGVTDTAVPDRGTDGILKITGSHTLFGEHRDDFRTDEGSLSLSTGDTQPFGGINGSAGLTVEGGLLKTTLKVGAQTATYQTTHTDAWGRVRKIVTPSNSGAGSTTTNIAYSNPDSTLRRSITNEGTGRILITESIPFAISGAITRSGIDVNGNSSLGSDDRFVESRTKVESGKIITTLSTTENNGLREVLRSEWTPSNGVIVTTVNGGEETISSTPNYTSKTLTTSSSKGWGKTTTLNNLGLPVSSNITGTGIPATGLTPVWRADGSLASVSFTIGSDTHSATFKDNGTLQTLIAPGRGNLLSEHSITGGVETLTVDGVTHQRRLDGTQETTSGGDVTNKTESLTSSGGGFKHTTAPLVGAPTETALNAAGAPTSKTYVAGPGENYTWQGELPHSVTLARGGNLIFGYSSDGAKDLTGASWPAVASGVFGSIPAIGESYTYDRAGRIKEIGDNSGLRSLAYQNGRLTSSAWGSGLLRSYEVVRGYDTSGRASGSEVRIGGSSIHSMASTPKETSDQIFTLSSGGITVTPQRDGAGRIVGYLWGGAGGSVSQDWTRGPGGRIEFASSNVPGAPTFNYAPDGNSFDTRGRRKKCVTTGGTWSYTYGSGGQLTNASHSTLGTFTYGFDAVGRRTDMGSANSGDSLNRTLAWTNSQSKTLDIIADPDARVWVDGQEILNFDGSYSHAIPSPGANGGWVSWATLAVLAGQGEGAGNPPVNPLAGPDAKAEKRGVVWVPPANESFSYDAAGNRQSSAQWDFGWDAKNQLVRARTKNYDNQSTPQGWDLTFTYDAEGRRVGKHVVTYQNGTVVSDKQITFVWDGWDLLYERHQLPSGLTTLERKYLWGPDIAGGATGGAGGLLLIRETKVGVTTNLIPLYDGTGHVTALTNLNKDLLATYTYGPFGEKINATGPKAQDNPWRYATKYLDEETGLYYFGMRYYDPVTGQWLSREPLGESESVNLYSYCHNDPVNHVDVLGLAEKKLEEEFWQQFVVESLNPELQKARLAYGLAKRDLELYDSHTTNLGLEGDPKRAAQKLAVFGDAVRRLEYVADASGINKKEAFREDETTLFADMYLGRIKGDWANEHRIADFFGRNATPFNIMATGISLGLSRGLFAALPTTSAATSIESVIATRGAALTGEASLATESQVLATQAANGGEGVVLFGQKRIGASFSTEKGVPSYLSGRPIADVVADLRAGRLTADQLPIKAFLNADGQMVTINNRTLGALSDAGLRPTQINLVTPTRNELLRLTEIPILDSPLPGPKIAITPSMSDLEILREITVPGF